MALRTKKIWFWSVGAALLAVILFLTLGKSEEKPALQEAAPAETHTMPDARATDVGALGRIEPRSRVVRVSHDAGPEGARMGELRVQEGQVVPQGEVIATFSDHGRKQAKQEAVLAQLTMLEAKIAAEQSNLTFTTREYERYRKLAKTQAVSQARRDAAERDFRQSQAQLNALKAELDSTRAEAKLAQEEVGQSILLAPLTGTVLKIHAWPGERVSDQGVVEMADLRALDVVAEIYERDMAKVKVGQQAVIHVPGMSEAITGTVRELGYLVRKNDVNDTDPLADRDNRVVEVRISLPPEASERLQHLLYMQVDVRLS